MGLGFAIGEEVRPGGPHWSYGSFSDFRVSLARLIGMNLKKMDGYCRDPQALPKSWKKWESDPICLLLNHSDCDGELSPEDCARCAPRLRELVGQLTDVYDVQHGLILADYMDECAKRGVPLNFC